jgi:hypothetical protein
MRPAFHAGFFGVNRLCSSFPHGRGKKRYRRAEQAERFLSHCTLPARQKRVFSATTNCIHSFLLLSVRICVCCSFYYCVPSLRSDHSVAVTWMHLLRILALLHVRPFILVYLIYYFRLKSFPPVAKRFCAAQFITLSRIMCAFV